MGTREIYCTILSNVVLITTQHRFGAQLMSETPDPVGTSLTNTKMLTFSTLGAVFTLKEVEFKKKKTTLILY